jgi:hypothetical protein
MTRDDRQDINARRAGSDVPPRGMGIEHEVLRQEDLSARDGSKVKPLPPERPRGYRGRHEGRG